MYMYMYVETIFTVSFHHGFWGITLLQGLLIGQCLFISGKLSQGHMSVWSPCCHSSSLNLVAMGGKFFTDLLVVSPLGGEVVLQRAAVKGGARVD